MSTSTNRELEEKLHDMFPCVSCGVNADPADGFGICTCGNEKLISELQQLIDSYVSEQVREARIKEVQNLLALHTRNIRQTITDKEKTIYSNNTDSYISKYETQKQLSRLQSPNPQKET